MLNKVAEAWYLRPENIDYPPGKFSFHAWRLRRLIISNVLVFTKTKPKL